MLTAWVSLLSDSTSRLKNPNSYKFMCLLHIERDFRWTVTNPKRSWMALICTTMLRLPNLKAISVTNKLIHFESPQYLAWVSSPFCEHHTSILIGSADLYFSKREGKIATVWRRRFGGQADTSRATLSKGCDRYYDSKGVAMLRIGFIYDVGLRFRGGLRNVCSSKPPFPSMEGRCSGSRRRHALIASMAASSTSTSSGKWMGWSGLMIAATFGAKAINRANGVWP